MIKRKMEYAGHVLRGSSGLSHLQILEGRVEGKKKVGCPIRIWMKDMCEWSLLGTYDKVKRAAEDRKRWKLVVFNLHIYAISLSSSSSVSFAASPSHKSPPQLSKYHLSPFSTFHLL